MRWTALGSWIMLATACAALIFSIACFRMIRTILQHVLKFDPNYYQNKIEAIHDEIVEDEASND